VKFFYIALSIAKPMATYFDPSASALAVLRDWVSKGGGRVACKLLLRVWLLLPGADGGGKGDGFCLVGAVAGFIGAGLDLLLAEDGLLRSGDTVTRFDWKHDTCNMPKLTGKGLHEVNRS